MTTNERIREAVKPGVAVFCATPGEVEQVFTAMGWDIGVNNTYEQLATDFPYIVEKVGNPDLLWDGLAESSSIRRNYTVVEFADVVNVTPIPCTASKLLGIEQGRVFRYGDEKYVIEEGIVFCWPKCEHRPPQQTLWEMLNHPEELHPVRVWSEMEKGDARTLIRCGIKDVRRLSNSRLRMSNTDNDSLLVDSGMFPSLDCGQTVSLSEIVERGVCDGVD